MQALQSGLITPAQYEMMMEKINQMEIGSRGIDTPQERDFLMQQGLLGGGQQPIGPATMPKAPEPTMPMSPMPSADPSQMQMSPMPQIGAPTQNETDFLGQFVDNAKKAMYR